MIFQVRDTVALKPSLIEDVYRVIIAFANTGGGELIIGVHEDGTVTGVEDPDEIGLAIRRIVREDITPDLNPFLQLKALFEDGKQILVVKVEPGTERPYYLKKKGLTSVGVFVRKGTSTLPASKNEICRMIDETDADNFEEVRSLEQNLTFEAASKEFFKHRLTFGQAEMKAMGIMTLHGVFTNLGRLLSDQCVHTIQVSVFEGTTSNIIKHKKVFAGSVLNQMNDVCDYISSETQSACYTRDSNYPPTAVKEAILNLVLHRNYSLTAESNIKLYKDRIEICSIGGIPYGLTMSDVMMGISVCRNKRLADIFSNLELASAFGTGLSRIKNAYSDFAVNPVFRATENTFKVILPNINSFNLNYAETDQQALTEEEQKIMHYASGKGEFTRKDVEKELRMSQSGSGRYIRKLVERNLIYQVGKGKNTCYRIMNKLVKTVFDE